MAFEAELAQVVAADAEDVVADLTHLLDAQRDPVLRSVLERGLSDVDGLRRQAGEELRRHWTTSIEPLWRRLRAVAEADVSWRLEQMADAGPRRVLETLHPRVRLEQNALSVDTSCPPSEGGEWDHGMVLVPCAFAWPDVLCLTKPGRTPTLSYAPRGVGRLWQDTTAPPRALAELVGRTRADTVARLDLPMTTTQLADALAVAAPTMNAHLQILRRAGVVTATRRGRIVLYARTSLGDHLAAVDVEAAG
jgi:DNA-binding transcriptional ArsR family regulator